MNIGFFCEGFNKSSTIALPWKHVLEIGKRIGLRGNSVHIFTDAVLGMPIEEELYGIPIHRIKKHGLLLDIRSLLASFDKEDIALVDWNGGPLSAFYFLRLRKSFGRALVWTLYQGRLFKQDLMNLRLSDVPTLYRFWNSVLSSFVPNFMIRKGTEMPHLGRIITLSKRLQEYLEGMGISGNKITTISSGVDTKSMKPFSQAYATERKTAFGFKPDDQIILYYGPLSSPRGADVVISALPKILKEIPTTKLVILARESINDSIDYDLETLARKQSAIRLVTGVMEQSILFQYLSFADVVALPFRFWPYTECPLTILESMAIGKPVITTYSGAISEIVKDQQTGFLVPPGNVDKFSRKMVETLMDKELLIEVARKARAYVEQFHDWDFIANLTFDVFREVVNGKVHA